MSTKHHRLGVGHGHVEFHGDKRPEADGIEYAGLSEHAVFREIGDFLHVESHQIERVGHHDDKALGSVLLDVLTSRSDDVGILVQQIFAGHTGLARQSGGHDDDIGTLDVRVLVSSLDHGIVTANGSGLG